MKFSVFLIVLSVGAAFAELNSYIATEPKDVDPSLRGGGPTPRIANHLAFTSSSSSDDLMTNLKDLVQGVCRDQSGALVMVMHATYFCGADATRVCNTTLCV